MATIQEINSEIMFGTLTNDQLNSIISAVKYRRAQLAKTARRTLTVGTDVKFVSTRTGAIMVGKVTKMAIKYATVDTNNGRWRVPANMLEVA